MNECELVLPQMIISFWITLTYLVAIALSCVLNRLIFKPSIEKHNEIFTWLNNAANIDSVVSIPYIVLIPSIHQLASNEAVCFSYKVLALILATEI